MRSLKWNSYWFPGSSPCCLIFLLSTTNMAAEFFINRFLSIDFPFIIDDQSVGSMRLFPMMDDKISADSHHYQQLTYSFTPLSTSDKLLLLFFFPFRENLNVNDALMELFILAYACKTACARRIIGMYMYFCIVSCQVI